MGTARFSRQVLKSKSDFRELFQKGTFYKGTLFSVVVYKKIELRTVRVAVCVSRRQGKAVIRNRLKRISRELLDEFIPDLQPCILAVMPHQKLMRSQSRNQRQNLLNLLSEATIMQTEMAQET